MTRSPFTHLALCTCLMGTCLMGTALVGPALRAAQDEEPPTRQERVDDIFSMYTTFTPGCTLGVIEDEELVFARGYGMANLEYGIALSPRSVLRIGSTSKQFAATAILLLEQEGKLSRDDDVRRHIPELRDYGTQVTIRQLIHHTSGYRDYLTLMTLAGLRDDDWASDDDVVAMLARQQELNFSPGSEFLYSNSGYFLLSQIVARVTGESLRDYAEHAVFEPLGMDHTHFHDDHTEIVPQRASGYAPSEDGSFVISMTTLPMIGDGGVFTTVEDLVHWDRNFYRPKVGGELLLDALHERGVLSDGKTLDYASGLMTGEYRGLRTVRHGGAFVGYRAELLRFPEQKVSVVCLCNRADANPSRLANRVADVWLEDRLGPKTDREGGGEDESEESTPILAGPLDSYAGAFYSAELDVTWRLEVVDGALQLEVGNSLDGTLEVKEEESFTLPGDFAEWASIEFEAQGARRDAFRAQAGRVKNLRFVRQ